MPYDTTVGKRRYSNHLKQLPVLHLPSVYQHAITITPAEPLGASVVLLPQRRRPSSKFRGVGFRITLFEACLVFTTRYGLLTR